MPEPAWRGIVAVREEDQPLAQWGGLVGLEAFSPGLASRSAPMLALARQKAMKLGGSLGISNAPYAGDRELPA